MNAIHYRKGMTRISTWCGARREPADFGRPDNSSPFLTDVTCRKCQTAAQKWLDEHKNQRAMEARIAGGRETMKWVYIAAPYTHPDPVANTHKAIRMANRFVAVGMQPMIPHLTLAWNLVTPMPAAFWYDYTMELMLRCDFVYRMVGHSVGGDAECTTAAQHQMPIFFEGDGVKPENIDGKLAAWYCDTPRTIWRRVKV